MSLSPRQFFHGTVHEIAGAVKPGKSVGVANYDYDPDSTLTDHGTHDPNEYVHAADEQSAWEFAGFKGRRHVYQLDPPDEGQPDPNSAGASIWPHPVPVVDRIDIAHPALWGSGRVSHVQGTLPPVDWNQFAPKNPGDANNLAVYTARSRALQEKLVATRAGRQQEKLTRLRAHRQIPGQGKLF